MRTTNTEPRGTMAYTEVTRRAGLAPREFLWRYLVGNRPLLVTDALRTWPALGRWTPASFRERFGALSVLLSDAHHPGRLERRSVAEFLDSLASFETPHDDGSRFLPYLCSRYGGEDDDFASAAFRELRTEWSRPYFLPARGYLIPRALGAVDPTVTRHPHFGVYVSPRGAVTPLHIDGGATDAVLCQLHGRKRVYLIPRTQDALAPALNTWRPGRLRPDPWRPRYGATQPLEATLEPGDVLFIPRSWLHEVYTLSASISLTYNFLHASNSLGWPGWRGVPRKLGARLPQSLRGLLASDRPVQ